MDEVNQSEKAFHKLLGTDHPLTSTAADDLDLVLQEKCIRSRFEREHFMKHT